MIEKIIAEINNEKKVIKNQPGFLYLSIENSVYNLMMNDGPLAKCGGARTVKSYGSINDLEQFLKLNKLYLLKI